MIDAKTLLDDSVDRVKALVDDLRERCDGNDAMNGSLRSEWSDARSKKRTAMSFGEWREDRLTQLAVGWVLSCVFVRFCEDNHLIDVHLAGPGDRLQVAKERYSGFVMAHPADDQRAYLLDVFVEMRAFAATARLFGEHNAVWSEATPSALACKELLESWWRLDDAGKLIHDFTDPGLDTRFLGDLYEDISRDVRERYALRQTPAFVESFILDRTLGPAIDEFGLDDTDLIDPACGSGHFLLGAFERLFKRFRQRNPSANPVGHAQAALARVAGVDLNPYAVAIARFRLLIAAIRVCEVRRLADAPAFGLRVAVGDSLLHGTLPGQQDLGVDAELEATQHLYATEDPDLVTEILSRTYKAVVANPPYIQGDDAAARAAYKARYRFCHKEYQLTVPFFERIFSLAVRGSTEKPAGFVGKITGNAFMKREFGKKLVPGFFPEIDLTHLIDTSGAYLPGHGTPTVIVLGRNRQPVGASLRAVMGLRGEPRTPAVPADGLVWTSIASNVDKVGHVDQYVSVVDWPRSRTTTHPMIFGGGAELWFQVDASAHRRLSDICGLIGYTGQTNIDPVMIAPAEAFRRRNVSAAMWRRLVVGDVVRDWCLGAGDSVLFPYDDTDLLDFEPGDGFERWVWPARTSMLERRTFNKISYKEEGRPYWEWHQVSLDRLLTPLSIAFAFVATHNHFALDRDGKVFKQSALVIKLPTGATEDDHFELLGPLNSSVGCFWMKGVFFPKGGDSVGQEGARIRKTWWDERYEFAATQMKSFPLVQHRTQGHALTVDRMAKDLSLSLPRCALGELGPDALDTARKRAESVRSEMVAVQESLDWRVLFDYGLIAEDLSGDDLETVPLQLGERAFEIVLARRMAAGEEQTAWFERHGSTPITELPPHWPAEYRHLVERRIDAIERDPAGVGFIERPEFKRRWNWDSWDDLLAEALDEWLLDAIEGLDLWRAGEVVTVARVTQAARQVDQFTDVAELAGGADVDLAKLVGDLLASAAVPHVAGLRLKSAGMRKRAQWEQTWELQRAEDAIDARTDLDPDDPQHLTAEAAAAMKAEQVGDIPKPPSYTATDMMPSVWKHRGKLDVPKERFISYPGAEAVDGDTTAVYGWAGWDHAQQGRALASLHVQRKPSFGPPALTCLLAGLWELVPWVKQWHNDPDPRGRRQGDELERFVQNEARNLGITTDALRGWTPT